MIYERTRAGRIQVLVNVMVLTEGFDMPQLEVAVIARPTQSRALYIQMVGRVLRLHDGKNRALIIDVVGASTGMNLATCATLTETPDGERERLESESRENGKRKGKSGTEWKLGIRRKLFSFSIDIIRIDGKEKTVVATVKNRNRKEAERMAVREIRKYQLMSAGWPEKL